MGALVLAALAFAPRAQIRTRAEPSVPIGVWYVVDREAASTVWRRDLRAIKSLGFNAVWTRVDWASSEPEPGTYRWQPLDELMTMAGEVGLKVVLQLDTATMPPWLGAQYPDAALVSDRGATLPTAAGVCLDHDGVRAQIAAFAAAVVERAARHRSLHAVDVWSEPHVVEPRRLSAPGAFCYCAHTQGRFRQWLKSKYGTVSALDEAWGRSHATWNDVAAPRLTSATSSADVVDWTAFIAAKLREDLRFKAAAARGTHLVTSHSDAPAVMAGPLAPGGTPDDWWMSGAVHHYGTSLFAKHAAAAPTTPVHVGATLDAMRSAAQDRSWWLAQLQAGAGVTGTRRGPDVTAADLRLWGWTAVARGAGAIAYRSWQPLAGAEASGYGLVDRDGEITERATAAGNFASVIARNPPLFVPLRPRAARVGILFNPASHLAGGDNVAHDRAARRSMLGFYRAMFEQNVQADFVHPGELVSGATTRYAVLFAGYPLNLGQDLVKGLTSYVEHGGTLIAEALIGSRLDPVFGSRQKLLRVPESISIALEANLGGELKGLSGAAIAGTGYAEHFEVTSPSTRVLARFPPFDGKAADAAITVARYGKGRAIRIGTFPAGAFEADPVRRRTTAQLFQRLVESSGVRPDVRIVPPAAGIEGRVLESRDVMLLIAINHADTPQQATLTFPAGTRQEFWQNMETGDMVTLSADAAAPSLTHTFAPRDVLVLMIRKTSPYDRQP